MRGDFGFAGSRGDHGSVGPLRGFQIGRSSFEDPRNGLREEDLPLGRGDQVRPWVELAIQCGDLMGQEIAAWVAAGSSADKFMGMQARGLPCYL